MGDEMKKLGRPFFREKDGEGVRRRNVTFSMDPDVYDLLRAAAESDHSSMSQVVEKSVVAFIKDGKGSNSL